MPVQSTTVFIADDHPIFRRGLEEVIAKEKAYSLVGSASDGEAALEGILQSKPVVAVLDIEMPKMNGLDVIRHLHEQNSRVHCMVLTMFQEESIFDKAMDYGVLGYLLKDSAIADILKGIEIVARGDFYISPSLSSKSLKTNPLVQQNVEQRLGIDKLTVMERQILRMISSSKSSRQIADELHLSIRTIENHRYNIVHKLGLSGNYSLLRFALDNKNYMG